MRLHFRRKVATQGHPPFALAPPRPKCAAPPTPGLQPQDLETLATFARNIRVTLLASHRPTTDVITPTRLERLAVRAHELALKITPPRKCLLPGALGPGSECAALNQQLPNLGDGWRLSDPDVDSLMTEFAETLTTPSVVSTLVANQSAVPQPLRTPDNTTREEFCVRLASAPGVSAEVRRAVGRWGLQWRAGPKVAGGAAAGAARCRRLRHASIRGLASPHPTRHPQAVACTCNMSMPW